MINGHSDTTNGFQSTETAWSAAARFGVSPESFDPYLLAIFQYPTTPRHLEQSLLLPTQEWLYCEAQRTMWPLQQWSRLGMALPPRLEALWPMGQQVGIELPGLARRRGINEQELGDPEIERILGLMIDANPWTALTEIEVTARDRAVTLRGHAPNERVKRFVEALAWQVPGVSDVHNGVEVRRRRPRQSASSG